MPNCTERTFSVVTDAKRRALGFECFSGGFPIFALSSSPQQLGYLRHFLGRKNVEVLVKKHLKLKGENLKFNIIFLSGKEQKCSEKDRAGWTGRAALIFRVFCFRKSGAPPEGAVNFPSPPVVTCVPPSTSLVWRAFSALALFFRASDAPCSRRPVFSSTKFRYPSAGSVSFHFFAGFRVVATKTKCLPATCVYLCVCVCVCAPPPLSIRRR